jgi:hypothetical protein
MEKLVILNKTIEKQQAKLNTVLNKYNDVLVKAENKKKGRYPKKTLSKLLNQSILLKDKIKKNTEKKNKIIQKQEKKKQKTLKQIEKMLNDLKKKKKQMKKKMEKLDKKLEPAKKDVDEFFEKYKKKFTKPTEPDSIVMLDEIKEHKYNTKNEYSFVSFKIYKLKEKQDKERKGEELITEEGLKYTLYRNETMEVINTNDMKDIIMNTRYKNPSRFFNKGMTEDIKKENEILKMKWNKVIRLLTSNVDFKTNYNNFGSYMDIVIFTNIQPIPDIISHLSPDFLNRLYMRDAVKNAIFNKYTLYSINKNAKDFEELIKVDYNDYINKNFRKNACFLTAIINKFYNRFNKIKSDGKRAYKELTYDRLCEVLGVENKPENIAVSIQNAVEKFFIPFKLCLDVYDIFMNVVYSYRPDIQSKYYEVLKIMIHDDHIYELNNNLHSLSQCKPEELVDLNDIQVSNKYNIMQFDDANNYVYMINNINDIKDKILLHSNEEKVKLKLITNKILDDIIIDIHKAGYAPKINFDGGCVKSFFMEVSNIKVSVENMDIRNAEDNIVVIENEDQYNKYHEINKTFYQKIFKPEYLSEFHSSVIKINDEYQLKPVAGFFEYTIDEINGIDERRAYTECLMNINKIPVFKYFDIYKKYNNEPINDLSYYIIECIDTNKEAGIIFNEKYSIIFGFVLKVVKTSIKFNILYYLDPSNIEEVDFKTPVQEVYKSNIDDELKKSVVNVATGLLEKKYNKKHITKAFNDINDAIHYKTKYDGKFIPLYKYKYGMKYDYFDNCDMIDYDNIEEVDKLFLVNIYKKERLENGFNAIKDMIYSKQKLKMYLLYKKVKSLGLKPIGIKTDCLLYTGDKSIIRKNFNLNNDIGNFKIEENKSIIDIEIKVNDNELINIPDFEKPNVMTVKNEYDTEEINKIINGNNCLLFKGVYPGVGKSTACKNYDKNLLIIFPCNPQCKVAMKEGYNAITFNRLFGLYGADQEMKNMKKYDISGIKTVLFDEVFLYEPSRLKRIDKFIKSNPDIKVLATGDLDQRDPVSYKNPKYLNSCVNTVFNNQVLLTEVKRFKKEEDKQRIKKLKDDIFNTKLDIVDTLKKHNIKLIYSMKDVKTLKNISFFRDMRCEIVNKWVHYDLLKNSKEYYEGLEIVCKKYYKCKDFKINPNYSFIIKKMTKEFIMIEDDVNNIQYKINPTMLKTHFRLPYCYTCDSIQGMTFGEEDKITIFDANTPYVDRKFLWTAITRCRYLDNVSVFIHSKQEIERLTDMKFNLYFRLKVENYKIQDAKKDRQYNDNDYIDNNWIFQEIEKTNITCPYCYIPMSLELNEDNDVISNITVDRIDNSKAHIKTNCRLSCLHCNITKK